MKTVLDSSVILDIVTDDRKWADASEAALLSALHMGAIVIGECVLAEISPAFSGEDICGFLREWKIQFIPSSRSSAIMAGQMYARYLVRGGTAKRVLPDFLIGAHAMENGSRLLARDRGYYRDYFIGLKILDPTDSRG